MIRYVAVIDLGKTNSKVAIVDTTIAKEIRVIKQRATLSSEALYPSLDHKAIETFIVSSLHALSIDYGIDAITVTTHGATAALIDDSGQLALPVLDYEFQDIDELRDEYEQHRPSFAETGSSALPGGLNIGAQLYWQKTNFPEPFASVHSVLTWPQYWIYRLTGEQHNDVTSLGCHTDLYEPYTQSYSALVDKMDWHAIMPATKHSGQLSGTLKSDVARRANLPLSLPVYTGIHDSNASLVPHLIAQKPPFSVVSTGTWFVVMALGGINVELNEARDTLLNVNAKGQSVPSARFMGGRERELLGITTQATDYAMDTFLNDHSTPGMLMPSVVPGTGPHPEKTARWIGLDENDKATAVLRECAVTLYLALMTHECMKLVGSEGPTFIEGPLAHDKHYAQMLAVLSGRSVMISESETGTSVGAAMLITAPVNPPDYTFVEVELARRTQLERYAASWLQQLACHAK